MRFARENRKSNEGMALIFAMLAIVIILGAMAVVMIYVQNVKKETDAAHNEIVLEEVAKAGVEIAIEQLWNDYIENNGNTTGNMASYKYFMNNVRNVPNTEDYNANGQQDTALGEEDKDGRNGWEAWPDSYGPNGFPMLEEAITYQEPVSGTPLAEITDISIVRNDRRFGTGTEITVRATATAGGRSKTAVQRLTIGGPDDGHGQFAVMANNISCILCHAEIRSLKLESNSDDDLFNSFDRVKVASLESLMVREGTETDSNIAGTLYTRGRVYKTNGSEYTPSQLASSSFNGFKLNTENGKIEQNDGGAMQSVPLKNADTNDDDELIPFANLYMDYPEDPEKMTDGPVPVDFPPAFPDDNANRHVDDDEFETVINASHGSVEFELDEGEVSGSVSAGVAHGVPHGQVYTGTGLPTTSNGAAQDLSSGKYDGNLILVGTQWDPIVINSNVAVNGDLVIQGPIKGRGRLLVRGNVYVTGDVTYANASDQPADYGTAADGSENLFAVLAGGSIMMGDYLTVRGVNHTAKDGDKYPSWDQYSIHMRDKNKSNSVTLKVNNVNKTETLKWGYFDQYSVDAGQKVTGRQGQQFSFTMSELKLFNNMELKKALADPDYTPRFYGLRESQPNNVYIYDSGDEHSVHYNETAVKKLSAHLIAKGLPLEILDRAAFHYLNPDGNWMSENTLRNIWYADELQRSRGEPFRFDGLMYSNNAIFAIVRSYTRHKSNTDGRMVIRGGVISADLGVFVPGNGGTAPGLDLFYDQRVENFLDVFNTNKVILQRDAFYYAKAAATEEEGA